MVLSDNPERDAKNYYEEQGRIYDKVNNLCTCACCGKPCGAERHFELFAGEVVACSEKCARKLLTSDDIEDIVSDYIMMSGVGPYSRADLEKGVDYDAV